MPRPDTHRCTPFVVALWAAVAAQLGNAAMSRSWR